MRIKFDEQLTTLHTELLQMCSFLEQGITSACNALVNHDNSQAQNAIQTEKETDKKEREIESLCIKLLLQQQPVAKDLRVISAALKMITDMERIGDQIADISEIVLYLTDFEYIKQLDHLPRMAQATANMVKQSINAFIKNDVELAKQVINMDNVVDELFIIIKKELVELIHRNGSSSEQALDFLMIAKYYERIGDHAVNIAEWVLFSLTGIHKGNKLE